MVDYWNTKSDKPKYVEDLDKELAYIKEWYVARVAQLDDYFGVDTGIDNVNAAVNVDTPEDGVIYDLQGQRLKEAPESGVYIQNGRKYSK